MQPFTGPYAPLVLQLELMRQEVEASENQAGSLGDYLDRGRPDERQRREAEAAMATAQANANEALTRLRERLRIVRTEAPEAVQQWADWHSALLWQILAEPATPDAHGHISDAQVRHHVAQQTLAEWEQVRQATMDYVRINWYFLKEYQERVEAAVKARG